MYIHVDVCICSVNRFHNQQLQIQGGCNGFQLKPPLKECAPLINDDGFHKGQKLGFLVHFVKAKILSQKFLDLPLISNS